MDKFVRTFSEEGIYTAEYIPSGTQRGCVAVCAPFGNERGHSARVMHLILKECAARGLRGLFFDYPGNGESIGSVEDCSISGAAATAAGTINRLIEQASCDTLKFLGIRSGAFVAEEASLAFTSELVLIHPFLRGGDFMRELALKEKIRKGLTGSRQESGLLMDGIPISEKFRKEIESADITECVQKKKAAIIQISPSERPVPEYKKISEYTDVHSVTSVQFWKPHENKTYDDIIRVTADILVGEK